MVPRHPNLVFTSAGDHSNLEHWLDGSRDFDLWVTYYGDQPGRFRDVADGYNLRKGSKFQNLHFAYETWPDQLRHYEAILVMDDDILIGSQKINRLFHLRHELDLWLLQPAFRTKGKLSWEITRLHPTARIRFTNFVEMTCPLFRTDKLFTFLQQYDPRLVGYGIDWWYLHAIGPDLKGHVAVVDEVSCVNPRDNTKGAREIDKVQALPERIAVWQEIRKSHRITIDEAGQVEYSRIRRPALDAVITLAVTLREELAFYGIRRIARRLGRAFFRRWQAGASKTRARPFTAPDSGST